GEELLRSTNMFVSHEHDVTTRLRDSGNNLLMRFSALDRQLEQRRPRPRWRAPMVEHQQLRWFRTTLLGRTPGWSPPAPAVGPWRPVRVESRTGFAVDDAHLSARLEGGVGILEASCDLRALSVAPSRAELVLERAGVERRVDMERTGEARFAGRLAVREPELWWPHSHGEPVLYRA